MVKALLGVLLLFAAADTAATPPGISSVEQENCEVLRAAMQYKYAADYVCKTRPIPIEILDWREPFPVGDCEDAAFRIRTTDEQSFQGCMMTVDVHHRSDYYDVMVGRMDVSDKGTSIWGNKYLISVSLEAGKWVARPHRKVFRPKPVKPADPSGTGDSGMPTVKP